MKTFPFQQEVLVAVNFKPFMAIVFLAGLSLMACAGPCQQAAQDDKAEASERFPQKMSPTFIRRQAQVEDIEIHMVPSMPAEVKVVVKGYLSDSCAKIDRIAQRREGQDFRITITTKRPADRKCLQALFPFEETITFEVEGLKAGVHTVTVNQMSESFTLEGDAIE